jgi:hypothetical protein
VFSAQIARIAAYREGLGKLSKFNPKFWETHLDETAWENISQEQSPWDLYNKHRRSIAIHSRKRKSAMRIIKNILVRSPQLSRRQKEIMTLYYFGGKTQKEIAAKLGISQPTVNFHITGRRDAYKIIGGAEKKIGRIIKENETCSSLRKASTITVIRYFQKKIITCTTAAMLLKRNPRTVYRYSKKYSTHSHATAEN